MTRTEAWMNLKFDGSQGTQRALNESNIDRFKTKDKYDSKDGDLHHIFEDSIKNA